MLVLIKSESQKKWTIHKSTASVRGIEAEYVVWVEPPKTKDELETTQVCGGEQYFLDDLIESDKAAEAATENILRAIASRPEEEWRKSLTDHLGVPEAALPELCKRLRGYKQQETPA